MGDVETPGRKNGKRKLHQTACLGYPDVWGPLLHVMATNRLAGNIFFGGNVFIQMSGDNFSTDRGLSIFVEIVIVDQMW